MTKHRWHEAIIAWANGETIQYKDSTFLVNEWEDYLIRNGSPNFGSSVLEWRVKPKHSKEIQNVIDTAMLTVDFDRIHTIMTALDWGWNGEGVPTINQLKKMVSDLCIKVLENNLWISQCGGFEVSINPKYSGIIKIGFNAVKPISITVPSSIPKPEK